MVDKLSEQQIEEFRDVFNLFDKRGSGVIDVREVGAAIQTMGITQDEKKIQQMVTEMDIHGNGVIEFREFLHLMARKTRESEAREEILRIFKAFDADGDGTISTEEMRSVITYLMDKIDEQEVKGIIQQIDRYDSGEIEYEEFVLLITG